MLKTEGGAGAPVWRVRGGQPVCKGKENGLKRTSVLSRLLQH